jgi:hypothetical protein
LRLAQITLNLMRLVQLRRHNLRACRFGKLVARCAPRSPDGAENELRKPNIRGGDL